MSSLQTIKSQFGPTQKDIAAALNLSQSAVARALGGRPHKMPEETVVRIQEKAKELGYRPQRIARILRNGRSHTIGVVYTSGSYHAPQERVTYLAHQAIAAGYQLVAADFAWFKRDERAIEDYLLGASVEGVIFCNVSGSLDWSFLKERSIPSVSMSPVGALGEVKANDAQADIRTAFREMTRHHLKQGSRRLSFLPSYRDANFEGAPGMAITLRVAGFVEAIKEAAGVVTASPEVARFLNLKVDPSPGANGCIVGEVLYPVWEPAHTSVFELGRVEAEKMIRGRGLPESLICSNDGIAAGALSSCIQYGIGIPETVRISGADDAPFSSYCGVPLTTIRQPAQEMTQWAIERIVALIENPALRSRCKTRTFPCEIIVRQSTDARFNRANFVPPAADPLYRPLNL